MSSNNVSAVLFVKDLELLSDFYRRALGFSLRAGDEQHRVLGIDGFDFIVHQIPPHLSERITIDRPPQRRQSAAIKLCFPVRSISEVREAAASLGGELDPTDAEWSNGGSITCKGHDPEGNVFQVFQTSPETS